VKRDLLRWRRLGIAVAPGRWPALDSLVLDVAARTGAPPPSEVWLTGDPTVSVAVVGLRRYLLVGLPLLRCLAAAELAALIGADLTVLAQPRSAIRRYARWAAAAENEAEPDASPSRRRARTLASLGALGSRIRQSADRAALLAAGDAAIAARALILSRLAFGEYWYYLTTCQTVSSPRWGLKSAISDLDDGWQRLLRYGLDRQDPEDVAGVVAVLHPALAEEARAARPTLVLRDEVAVASLTEREQRVLVQVARGLSAGSVRWYRFADVPPERWVHRAQRDADNVRMLARIRLDRDPADDVEVVATVTDWAEAAGILVEAAALPDGWRLEHPAIRGVLRGPQGEALDVNALAARAAAEPAARATLDALLRGQPAAAAATAPATSARSVGSDQGPTR